LLLAQLELNEAAEVEFGIEIHGTSERTSDIRFIIEGPDYGIVCKCTENNGTITALIPKLKGILPAGQFEAKLEVVLDGKYFKPLQESIEFKPLVEFDVTSTKARPATEATVNTRTVKVRVIENEKNEDEMKAKEFDSTEEAPKEEPKKAEHKAAEEKAPTGTKPTQTWDQIVKQSITRPENAPKIEKGEFDYDNVAKATPIVKSSTKSTASSTATKNLPPQSKEQAAPKQQSSPAPSAARPGQQASAPQGKKTIDKEKAKQVLEKLNGFKTRLGELKSKQAK